MLSICVLCNATAIMLMHMYVHICFVLCMHHAGVYMYVCMYEGTYVHLYMCMLLYTCVVRVCLYACMCIVSC